MEEARLAFEQAVESVHDPHVLAWSHIYLGRIYDFQQNPEAAEENYEADPKIREAAIEHYRPALATGEPAAETNHAAGNELAAPNHERTTHAGKTTNRALAEP